MFVTVLLSTAVILLGAQSSRTPAGLGAIICGALAILSAATHWPH